MAEPGHRSSWRLHVTLVAGLALCAVGFWVELGRGIDGHLPAWAYVVEWPFFAACGAVVWWRLLRGDDHRPAQSSTPPEAAPRGQDPDPDLAAWREYVARFEARESEGGASSSDRAGPPPP